MSTILWQSRSSVVFRAFNQGELINAANGGNAYDFQAIQVLKKHFEISVDATTVQQPNEGWFQYWWRMRNYRPVADIFIMEPFPLLFGFRQGNAKTVAIIHHIDTISSSNSLRHRWFFHNLKQQLIKMDLVITVSAYWENYLKTSGCKNVKVIYNSFNRAEYEIPVEAVNTFKRQYGLNDAQPIVYIGNAARQKGVYETYEALKNLNYQLIMTGAENRAADLPVTYMNLTKTEYITLLHAADAVVIMSRLPEGWSRIAHESLLCKTPVVGSGTGGMKELLDGSRQKIITDIADLPAAVKSVLENKIALGNLGYAYVARFDQNYFEKEWTDTIEDLLKS